jgi:hypothetical protein
MMSGGAAGEFRRRVERAAELRAARAAGGTADGTAGGTTDGSAGETAQEDPEVIAAEEEARQQRRKIDDGARAEFLIRDAMAHGKFDHLKYAGKPIPGLGDGYDPDWWVKGLIQREHITGLGPKAILLRSEDAGLDARLDAQHSEKQVREMVNDFNARVIDARRQLQGGPPVTTKTRDADVEVERWHERRSAAAAAAAAAAEPEPETKRPWWRRLWTGSA